MGGGQGFEHQVIVIGHVVLATKQVVIPVVIWGIRNYNGWVGMAGLEEKQKKSKKSGSRHAAHDFYSMRLRR